MTQATGPVRAVTFDLDETVWATRAVLERAEKTSYTYLCERLPGLGARFNFGGMISQRRAFYSKYPDKAHDFTFLRRAWLAALGAEYGAPPGFADEAFDHWWALRNKVRLFEGVDEMLTGLRADGVGVGAITNGNASVEQVGAAHLFDFVVTAEEAGAAKPDRRIFDAALEHAGCSAADTVHVGDDPRCDVLGAMTLGMYGVWINPRLLPWPGGATPTAVINNVLELPGVLHAIDAART